MHRFPCLVCFSKCLRVPFSFRRHTRVNGSVAVLLSLLLLLSLAASASAQVSTSTTLSVTNTSGGTITSVSSGTVVVLTASVTNGSSEVKLGTVNFCDATATYCEDAHLLGSAQVTSKGTAVFKFRPAPGSHSYKAFFQGTTHGTTLYAASASSDENLTVTGGPYPTTTSMTQSGTLGNYTLSATVTSANGPAFSPSETVDFLDTANSNYVLGSPMLTPGPSVLSYAAPVSIGTGSGTQPMWSVMADFNQDGIPDIAVIDFNNPNIYSVDSAINIYFGNADGTFTQKTTIDTATAGAVAIAAGDLNGDGYPDLVVACDGALDVFINNGSGGFNSPANYNLAYTDFASYPATQYPDAVAIGDLNHDGHLDVVMAFALFDASGTTPYAMPPAADFPGQVAVALGNGDGSLQFSGNAPYVPFYGTNTYQPDALVLADLTGNGNLDLITGSEGSGVSVLEGNGDGTFQNAVYASLYRVIPSGSASMVVADFNGDGKPDLAVTNAGTSPYVGILLGNGDLTFAAAENGSGALVATYVVGNSPYWLVAADLNGDGIPDLATANNSDNTVTVMLGNGDGTFQAPLLLSDDSISSQTALTIPAGNAPYSIQAGDFSSSGIPSLVVVDESGNTVSTLTGSLSTSATASITGISPVGASSGLDEVQASYLGDSYYGASTSNTLASLVPEPVPTTLGLMSSASTVTVGGQVTLTATLSPSSAQNHTETGAVTFYSNGTSIGTATISNGVATLTPKLETVQTNTFTASYAGDSNFNGSTSSSVSVTVQKAATTLTLQVCNYNSTWTCPATTSNYGGEIEVNATLSPSSIKGGPSSDGEVVTFYNNGTSIGTATLTYGSATLNLDQTAAGSYSFTASYAGDASFGATSTSPPSPMTVAKVTPSVSLGVSPVSTDTYGQPVYLTATFNTYPYNVSGETVTFYNGANIVGTSTFGSQSSPAMLTLNNLPVGSYNFSAKFSGDSNYFSTTTTTSALTMQPASTTLTVSAPSSTTFTYGSPVTVQVFLYPYNVQGGNTTNGEQVTLYQNGVSAGTSPVSNGVAMFTIPAPPVGTNAYTASYLGDTSFGPSTAAAAYVTVQQATTTMGITTNAVNGISGTGQPVTLTATMSSNLATGTAIFYQNGNDIGNGTLANGVATLTVSNLPEGNYTFGASYSGDANFTTATASPTASLTVLLSTTLTLTVNPAHYAAPNQPVTITVTLSPSSIAGHNTDGEMVYIYNGASQFGNATLSNGVGTYSPTNGLPEGTYSFTAVYDSDSYLANATTATPVPFAVVTGQLFVVNTSTDDAGSAANCTPQGSTTINSTDGSCSLRDALLAAAAAPEGASVSFATSAFPAANTITLTNGGLTLPANTTLTGPTLNSGGANVTNLVTVDGNGSSNQQSSTVFTVTGTGTAISNLTISGGWLDGNGGTPFNGGGILNSGTLMLTNSTVTNNGAVWSGGGIYNTGTLTVLGSTIAGNSATLNGPGSGGGIDNESNGTLTVIDSTIVNNNMIGGYGAGIAVGSGTATLVNSTISGNSGGQDGLYNGAGTVKLGNTIVSGNNTLEDIQGTYTDNGGNIIGYVNGSPINNNNLNLAPLDNYGGPTQTMLPLPGSSAICTGSSTQSPSQWLQPLTAINIDQRGYPNYNLVYGQLPRTPPASNPLPSACFDSGAVQTNYTAVQFQQTSYTGLAGGAVTPIVTATVTENAVSRQAVPVTLNYSGAGNLYNNGATTATGTGAVFSGLSVDTAGSGALSTQIIVAGTSYIKASTNLSILPAPQIAPGSESISAASGTPLVQIFTASGGSGDFQLTNTGTLPTGLTLTPPAAGTGSSWTLSGAPTQLGTYNFTLTATDVTNSIVTVSQSYTLTVAPSTTTTLVASPASSAPVGQTVTLTATVSSPTANGTVSFFDGGNLLGSGAVSLTTGSPNTATLALNASTLGAPLSFGPHSFTAQFSGDATDAASTSITVPYNVVAPNFVVNTTSDDDGSFPCTSLASTSSNTTDGNNGGAPGTCTLRDALNTASGLGAGSIYFDTTVFAASNLASNPAGNTIAVNVPSYGSITIQSNTTIQGLTSGNGATLTNLVTVDGGGSSVADNGTIFYVPGSSAAINNLNINNGYASNGGSGGAITNAASLTVFGSTFTGNQATSSGGAIFNVYGTSLTVANSTFSGNSTTGGNGGAIDSGCGNTLVSNSTFYQNNAANGGNGYGGAINNDNDGNCTLTVNSSTIVGNSTDNSTNSDGYGGGGGGISSSFLLYLTNNVITGNTIAGAGEDDLDDNFWSSNYWTGNNLTTGNNIINGNFIGLWNGETENGTNVTLAPIANYGGPTQTMIPLPGSVAICGGIAGGTTDQRGDPLQPVGGYCPSGTVDSGSVQTNYALAFTTEPPSNAAVELALTPAPVLTLTESGIVFTPATSTVTITDLDGALDPSGTSSTALSAGTAAFSNLLFASTAANDTLTASVSLNPNLSPALNLITSPPSTPVTVTSLAFPATMISPTPGLSTLLGASNVPFQWTAGGEVTLYQLDLGTIAPGASDLYRYKGTATSTNVPSLPANGVPVYARLSSFVNGVWQHNDYLYTESGTPVPANLTSPTPGLSTVVGSSNVSFQWDSGTGVALYQLDLSAIAPGDTDLFVYKGTATSATAPSLPAFGSTIYARLYSKINGVWQFNDYVYTESGTPTAVLTSPAPGLGTVLDSSNVSFQWNTGAGVAIYQLNLSAVAPGGSELFVYKGTALSAIVPSLPANGITVYARLYSKIGGVWQFNDYVYTESGSPTPAMITSPTPGVGTVLGASNVPFQWNAGTGVTLYQLNLSVVAPGGSDLFVYKGTALSANVPSLPSTGVTVYARLFSYINGTWQHNDYLYIESGSPTPATLISPTPGLGTVLGASDLAFQWDTGTGVTLYQLNLSAVAPGASDLYLYKGTATNTTVPALPANGATVYARLWSKINGVWQFNDYVYTEQ